MHDLESRTTKSLTKDLEHSQALASSRKLPACACHPNSQFWALVQSIAKQYLSGNPFSRCDLKSNSCQRMCDSNRLQLPEPSARSFLGLHLGSSAFHVQLVLRWSRSALRFVFPSRVRVVIFSDSLSRSIRCSTSRILDRHEPQSRAHQAWRLAQPQVQSNMRVPIAHHKGYSLRTGVYHHSFNTTYVETRDAGCLTFQRCPEPHWHGLEGRIILIFPALSKSSEWTTVRLPKQLAQFFFQRSPNGCCGM
jgi:hypothetical protein